MSKYIKLDDAINKLDEWFCEPYTPTELLADLPTIEVSEERQERQDAIDVLNAFNKAVEGTYEDCISEFRDYQIEWLTAHCDIELEPVLEDLIVRFLKDTAEMFVKENAPSVAVRNNRITAEQSSMVGEWKWESDDICDNCGYEIPHLERVVSETVLMNSKDWEYCPNCGAKMKV